MIPTRFRRLRKAKKVFLSLLLFLTCALFVLQDKESQLRSTRSKFIDLQPDSSFTDSSTNGSADDADAELQTFKSLFKDLWRLAPKSDQNHVTDRVQRLENWTRVLVRSRFVQRQKPKEILVFDGVDQYYSTNGKVNCPFLSSEEEALLRQKCVFKEDKLFSNSAFSLASKADAFLNVRNWNPVVFDQTIASVRHVSYILESPFVTRYAQLGKNNVILASYWSGSDVVLPYGYFSQKKKTLLQERNYASGKSEFAAILVSNCKAINDRLSYVRELQRYVPVHIYGQCGPYKCDWDCFSLLKKYKFYLAFEKASCSDYITEKFWSNAFSSDAIPVVMGAKREEYEALAPPNSYVHIEDFPGPKELAEYMEKVAGNETLYNDYFKWKEEGVVNRNLLGEAFCRICSILHFADVLPPPEWEGKDATWTDVNECLPRGRWYWKRHNNPADYATKSFY